MLMAALAWTVWLSNSAFAAELDRDAIRRELQDFSRAGFNKRLGPDYNSYNPSGGSFPTIYMAPTKQDLGGRPYQIGGPWSLDPGDYSSSQGQVLYSPDAGNLGVDRVNVLEWAYYTFSEKPEPPWWGGFRPDPGSVKWTAASSGAPGVPVAIARGMGWWANCGVIVFSSGLVGSAGTATGYGKQPTLQLPAGKIPTAVSVTPRNEMALITVTDARTRKGQIAVVAIESGNEPIFVHDWFDRYPCAPNVAWHAAFKLLGYIDLPGMEFPTGISAVGTSEGPRLNGFDGNVTMLSRFNLANQADRDLFRTGYNADFAQRAGFAVVISKYENKAAFIDLQPLFERVHDRYFTTPENFQKTRNLGSSPTQWPTTFDADPAWKPKVVKVVDVPQPTAVIANMSGGNNARAYVASLDGKVGLYKLGGLATTAAADPAQIQRVSEATVGRNPTCLAYQKGVRDTIIAVSRGDREIAWITNSASGPRVFKRLRDSRLSDPVFVEMADTHGVETSLITVCDFNGRKVVNYRFAPVVFATQGGAVFGIGPSGTDEFECGGVLNFPGNPFSISAANVN
jgi:hypothetical protein